MYSGSQPKGPIKPGPMVEAPAEAARGKLHTYLVYAQAMHMCGQQAWTNSSWYECSVLSWGQQLDMRHSVCRCMHRCLSKALLNHNRKHLCYRSSTVFVVFGVITLTSLSWVTETLLLQRVHPTGPVLPSVYLTLPYLSPAKQQVTSAGLCELT